MTNGLGSNSKDSDRDQGQTLVRDVESLLPTQTALKIEPSASARILVVDDETERAESLSDFLTRKEGFSVEIAHDGMEIVLR